MGFLLCSAKNGEEIRNRQTYIYPNVEEYFSHPLLFALPFPEVMESGAKMYFTSGWNWVDIGMDTLMMYAFITWGVLSYQGYQQQQQQGNLGNPQQQSHVTSMHMADGAFTVAIIFSFFRILYLCQVNYANSSA